MATSLPDAIPPPIWASFPTTTEEDVVRFVVGGISVSTEKTACDGGIVVVRSVDETGVEELVLWPINDCDGMGGLVVEGVVVDGALVVGCVGGGVGALASKRK